MSRVKIGLLFLLIGFIAIQFIQPARNESGQVMAADITKIYTVPANVKAILKMACYDCHSNNTNYPWYATSQPIAWWLALHIKKGKLQLNYDEFGNYTKRRQLSKLKSMVNSIKDETMPLASYTLVHQNAKLNNQDKVLLLNWAKKTIDSLLLKN